MAYVHMIRQIATGKFSTGGATPRFTSKGKQWTSTNSLNCHLRLFTNEQLAKVYKGCELVAYELTESASDTIADIVERRRRKDALQDLVPSRDFVDFIDKLDKDDKTKDFPWVVHVDHYGVYSSRLETLKASVKETLNTLGIKKSGYRNGGLSFAFSNKTDAAKFRISIVGTTYTFDSRTLLSDPLEEE